MAHIEITIRIPADLDAVTAQRINQVCRSVMTQFPGIDDGPGDPCRMFLTTLDTFGAVLNPADPEQEDSPGVSDTKDGWTSKDVGWLSRDRDYNDGSGVYNWMRDSGLRQLVSDYTEKWGSPEPEVDRGEVLRAFMAGENGRGAQEAFTAYGAERVLIEAGATPEQASNILAVGTALQMIQI